MFKSFRKKGKNGKRGSMLTLVLVIVAMGLIFVTSAVMITNSTRTRYYDNVLTGQARLVSTAVAESFCSALAIQEISDENLSNWCDNDKEATITLDNVPGLGIGGTKTTVKFDSDDPYLLATFTTTIGTKADGGFATENCTVYFKAKGKKNKVDRFKNLLEVGLNADMGGFDIGKGYEHGSSNTCFFHGNTTMTETSGNNVYSDVIVTGDTAFGNGTKIEGSFIFAGPNAHLPKFTGSLEAENVFFVSPDGYDKGSVASSNADDGKGYVDISNWSNTLLYNFELNKALGQNGEAGNWVNMDGQGSISSSITDPGFKNDWYGKQVKKTWINETETEVNADKKMEDLFNNYVKAKAEAALSAEQAYPLTPAQVAAEKETFLENVPDTYKQIAQKCIDSKAKASGAYNISDLGSKKTAGVYYADTCTMGQVELDGDKGPYILVVGKELKFNAANSYIKVTNNNTSDDSKWLRIILLDNAKITIGVGGSGTNSGIMTAQDVTIGDKTYKKANAYIYGGDGTHVNFTGDHKHCEAYIGLYGPNSGISVQGIQESLIGRWECSNIKTLNANGASLPWSPMPTDGSSSDKWKAKESNYEIVRFRYYY